MNDKRAQIAIMLSTIRELETKLAKMENEVVDLIDNLIDEENPESTEAEKLEMKIAFHN